MKYYKKTYSLYCPEHGQQNFRIQRGNYFNDVQDVFRQRVAHCPNPKCNYSTKVESSYSAATNKIKEPLKPIRDTMFATTAGTIIYEVVKNVFVGPDDETLQNVASVFLNSKPL